MQLLTKNTDYAVRALIVLAAHEGDYVSARAISAAQNIPYEFLRKILQTLIKQKFVVSKEGKTGGVKLGNSPSEIKLEDVIRAFQGEVRFSECMFRERLCANRAECALRHKITKIEQKVVKEFKGITIAALLKGITKTHEKKNN
ncbi:MAG: Rrf2 family transcriptional regulator [Candidatus Omnitrophica bacterium]|nr:Rrf2 family transcriptional regulator [Candidatus Omnitrophota bacterium]